MHSVCRFVIGLGFVALSNGLTACSSSDGEVALGGKSKLVLDDNAALLKLAPHFNQQWAMATWWEDGLAEVATYEAERVVYDKVRRFEYTLITVKEEFTPQFDVKADTLQRPDLFPVMKVNQFCRIETDQYPYHYLTSLFFRRDEPVALHKLTTSSQEWCGNTFKAITDEGLHYLQTYNSYWDGQGSGERQLRRDAVFEDALPYTLRSLRFARKPAFQLVVTELQQTSKAARPNYYTAQLKVEEGLAVDTPEAAWRVTVALAANKQNVYWFAKKYPNVLLRQTTWDGRNLRLKSVRRYAYWQT
ncbi:hypothetical protein SAMN00120144_1960 [Hymenobacter roseosalivarius DSM 11622]|uniref:Maf-like protein n=1 Tax=Hymenobacter roseosalivarius DSM 11622 TaxID=645990 RepID=A0A1W1W422_9BACT|nr:hypothetical protein [Hymenobacter roseosalivarius]SMC00346.1 hypothetical protein SAMN00120144_1960 [Hymenobacter roseosalivarius DSM 11622]